MLLCIVPYENTLRTLIHRPLCALRYGLRRLQGVTLQFEEYRYSRRHYLQELEKAGFRVERTGWVELDDPTLSYTLYVDYGTLFQDRQRGQIFGVNAAGRLLKRLLHALSPWSHCEGIIAVCRKA